MSSVARGVQNCDCVVPEQKINFKKVTVNNVCFWVCWNDKNNWEKWGTVYALLIKLIFYLFAICHNHNPDSYPAHQEDCFKYLQPNCKYHGLRKALFGVFWGKVTLQLANEDWGTILYLIQIEIFNLYQLWYRSPFLHQDGAYVAIFPLGIFEWHLSFSSDVYWAKENGSSWAEFILDLIRISLK